MMEVADAKAKEAKAEGENFLSENLKADGVQVTDKKPTVHTRDRRRRERSYS